MKTLIGRLALGVLSILAAFNTSAREWTDDTGGFTVEAEFQGIDKESNVLLRDAKGKIVRVPLNRLSDLDRWYLKDVRKHIQEPLESEIQQLKEKIAKQDAMPEKLADKADLEKLPKKENEVKGKPLHKDLLSSKELRKLLRSLWEIKRLADSQETSGRKSHVLREAVAKIRKEYGQFRVKLVFPVIDVSAKGYLTLGKCSEPFDGNVGINRDCWLKSSGNSSNYKAMPKVNASEVLSIGKGTHQYEVIVLVTLVPNSKSERLYLASIHRATSIWHVLPLDVHCKLVKAKK